MTPKTAPQMHAIIADLTRQLRIAERKADLSQRVIDRDYRPGHLGRADRRTRNAQLARSLDRVASLALAIDTLRPLAERPQRVFG